MEIYSKMADGQHPSPRRQNITTMHLYTPFTIYLLILAIIVSTCLQRVSVSCSKLCQECDQGRCLNETCTCLPGWRGVNCDECYGRIRFVNLNLNKHILFVLVVDSLTEYKINRSPVIIYY